MKMVGTEMDYIAQTRTHLRTSGNAHVDIGAGINVVDLTWLVGVNARKLSTEPRIGVIAQEMIVVVVIVVTRADLVG